MPDGHGSENTVLLSEPLNKNLFLRGFLADLYLRPSCYACPAKCLKSGSDVTIGDFWGIEKVMPEMDDDKGVSVVMVNRGIELPDVDWQGIDYEEIVRYNPSVERSVRESEKRKIFFQKESVSMKEKVVALTRVSLRVRIKRKMKSVLYHIVKR